jgi:DNA modification methylase
MGGVVTLWLDDGDVQLILGDAREQVERMDAGSAACIVTSPPYLDKRPEYPSPTLDEFTGIFASCRRVVTGAMLLNVGRMFRDGREVRWWVQLLEAAELAGWDHLDTVVWIKPNGNPIHGNVVADKHEYVFVLGAPETALNTDAVRVPYAESSIARMRRGWSNQVGVKGDTTRRTPRSAGPNERGARPPSFVVVDVGREKGNPHPAPMAEDLALDMISLASWPGDVVLDPFCGSGTTGVVARRLGRRFVGVDLSADYLSIAGRRLQQLTLL